MVYTERAVLTLGGSASHPTVVVNGLKFTIFCPPLEGEIVVDDVVYRLSWTS